MDTLCYLNWWWGKELYKANSEGIGIAGMNWRLGMYVGEIDERESAKVWNFC